MTRIMLVEARFYDEISDLLLAGAKAELEKAGVEYDLFTVPGALEIPAAIRLGSGSRRRFDAYVALGCVLRGETSHYDIVSTESARGLVDLAVQNGLLIGNGILTCENEKQALARAKLDGENRGGAAVRAVFSLLSLKKIMGCAEGGNVGKRRRWRDA